MAVYKLFWDEFSAWYLEIIKPAYGSPIDKATFDATLGYFDALLKLLHPFMPFITEELWQNLAPRKDGESIMVSRLPEPKTYNSKILSEFETLKETIAGIRTIRKQKNIPQKEALQLLIKGNHNGEYNCVIEKIGNISSILESDEKPAGAASFLVGATEYSVPVQQSINLDEELKKLQGDLEYYNKFLDSVRKKLSNEKFVANAPEKVVALERKKEADALEKINTLNASILALKGM